MRGLARRADERLLIGSETADDAAVVRLTDELALVLTIDFFTPIVDDPFDYGRIAAANALSDVHAMGGRPAAAMNVVAFPLEQLGGDVLREILRGGAEVAHAAGISIVGGHSIDDAEPKYGLAVTGTVHPGAVISNAGARAGDALVLTKPLGVGAITTARKRGHHDDALLLRAVDTMTALNDAAAMRCPAEAGETAATPGFTTFADGVGEARRRLVCDATTSGGLLVAVAPERAGALPGVVVGEVVAGTPGAITVR